VPRRPAFVTGKLALETHAVSSLHRNYVDAIERGAINPTFRVLVKLTTGLRVPLSELMTVYERERESLSLPGPVPGGTRTHDR